MNAKESHDKKCKGKYHTIVREEQNIIKCNECGFAPRDSQTSEEEWYELLEETFNQPYPTEDMIKEKTK